MREFFPKKFSYAVRQKSRWITGIVFQGTKNLGWSTSVAQNYFLWRDRRGGFANLVGLLVNITVLIAFILYVINWLFPQSWQFPSLLDGGPVFVTVLMLNVALLINRVFQRFFFVCSFYGISQGLLSIPRIMWGNIINFFATWRAVVNVIRAGDSRRVAWDKTQHEIPSMGETNRKPIGSYLVEMGYITHEQLETQLQKGHKFYLGRELVMNMMITPQALGKALAQQFGYDYEEWLPLEFDADLIAEFPRKLALRYGVLPMQKEDGSLSLAMEKFLSPVALGAIARQVGADIKPVMLPTGFVTLALRYWYGELGTRETDPMLIYLQEHPCDKDLVTALARYQILLGDLIQEMGMISPQIFTQALFDYDPLKVSIGRFLLSRGLISKPLLQEALKLQRALQQQARELALGVTAQAPQTARGSPQ